ncbi:SGNH/GDSL hydrolase family protein [Natronoglycomyces albus]|uniref:SGNH/GDSL hydrolase family protein n=1 Tax=Natronoglycomyces albus TaxID=2811108 RepID=A0A895XKW0_9ACTN|nr:SGNH/GDSL hydrolase family protein [Natronoglycomyces albus]QSB05964.1 SGNH/GDSL hydrolase family protein [Natronoglycomyces albus]
MLGLAIADADVPCCRGANLPLQGWNDLSDRIPSVAAAVSSCPWSYIPPGVINEQDLPLGHSASYGSLAALAPARGATVVAATAGLVLALNPAGAHAEEVSAQSVRYVALGDSYTSGAGAGAGSYDGPDCLRSNNAHSVLWANRIGADLDFQACSGATIPDVRNNQLGALSPETDIVTIGIGGNDTGWVDVLIACGTAFTGECWDDIAAAEHYVRNILPGRLNSLYSDIRAAAPNTTIAVTGYPRLFNGDNCSWLVDLTYGEQMALNDAADLLNAVVAGAASRAGFSFVDVRSNFEGHVVCDDPSYIHGLRAPIVKESFHPNARGQNLGYFSAMRSMLVG